VDEKTHTSSQSELECVYSSSETLKGGFKIGCRPKFWRVVIATTTEPEHDPAVEIGKAQKSMELC